MSPLSPIEIGRPCERVDPSGFSRLGNGVGMRQEGSALMECDTVVDSAWVRDISVATQQSSPRDPRPVVTVVWPLGWKHQRVAGPCWTLRVASLDRYRTAGHSAIDAR